MTELDNMRISDFVDLRNSQKKLFTAGPASMLKENITGLSPCFGRGDSLYIEKEEKVLNELKKMTGHSNLARMQGAGSLAIEIMACNFLSGDVLVVDTGYYSSRVLEITKQAKNYIGEIKNIKNVNWKNLSDVNKNFDWVFACSTETSTGLLQPIGGLRKIADKLKAKLMLDATASIGLETDHDLADVISYSSCKGLFGLTGASFIAFNDDDFQNVPSFYLNIKNHIDKKMTGPYHAILSLVEVLPKHDEIRQAVFENKSKFIKRMKEFLKFPTDLQPALCTYINKKVTSIDDNAILYFPRNIDKGSIVCHLGEAHLGTEAKGIIQDSLRLEP